jgi:hypothetical protein
MELYQKLSSHFKLLYYFPINKHSNFQLKFTQFKNLSHYTNYL